MKGWRSLVLLATLLALSASEVWASGGGTFAWETNLQKIVESASGPVARSVGILSIVLFGLGLCFSEGAGLRVVIGIVFGLSIAFTAAPLISSLFGFAGGVLV